MGRVGVGRVSGDWGAGVGGQLLTSREALEDRGEGAGGGGRVRSSKASVLSLSFSSPALQGPVQRALS